MCCVVDVSRSCGTIDCGPALSRYAPTCFKVGLDDDDEQELRWFGHTKDHRPDLLQSVIGFEVTGDGIPVRCWVRPGGTSDVQIIAEAGKDLSGWILGRVLTAADPGFSSAENPKHLQRAGVHYMAGERMRSRMSAVEQALGIH